MIDGRPFNLKYELALLILYFYLFIIFFFCFQITLVTDLILILQRIRVN